MPRCMPSLSLTDNRQLRNGQNMQLRSVCARLTEKSRTKELSQAREHTATLARLQNVAKREFVPFAPSPQAKYIMIGVKSPQCLEHDPRAAFCNDRHTEKSYDLLEFRRGRSITGVGCDRDSGSRIRPPGFSGNS